jgi:class 3 adenylate cyclase
MEDESAGSAPPTADAESRFVALLKFDLVDSTGISSALSPSDELELQRGYKSAVERLVNADQVKVEWEGDGGLVVFGYPEVRVDAAQMAVATGLRLIEAVRSVKVIPSVQLELRVGIASGRVTIDKTRGSLSRVMPVSRAARLMEYAEPGQLLIAEDTKHLVEKHFEYENLGVIELQGAGRMPAWRVVRDTGEASRFVAQRVAGSSGSIFGREHVLADLSAAWSAALQGRGSAVCLVGDSGMGKSRLARAVLEWAKREAIVLEIDCTPSTGNSPLLPIGVLLRRRAGIGASTSEAGKEIAAAAFLTPLLGESEARESLKYLGPLFGIESTPIPLDKTRDQVQAETIAAIIAIVRALAAQKPLAVLCEDLHWADDTTGQVVQALAGIVAEMPLLLIVTRWPKPVTQIDLEGVTASFTAVPVEPLETSNAADLVSAVADGVLSPERVNAIVSRCGGVPLLLEEVTRSMMEQADADPAIRTSRPSDSRVPPELQLVVESRLEQWPHLRGIIEAASVLGREFPMPVLQDMVAERRADVSVAIELFAEHGLFKPRGAHHGERASFRHALIRDAVYETLVSKDYLRRLHSRAADALSSRYSGTPDASPDVLAHHLREAQRLVEAIRIRLAAGKQTFERGAYVEAKGHCDAVRTLLEEVGDKALVRADAYERCVLLGMVGTGMHGYSAEPAELAYREAQEMFDDDTGPDLRYPVVRGLATASLVRGDLATAHRYSLEGLALAERSHRPDYRIDAMSVRAYTTLYFGRLEDCRSWIDRCLELYDTLGGETFRYPVPQDAKTAALALLPTVAWLLGDAAGAEQAIDRGLRHVEALGREFDLALLNAWTAGTRYTQRRYREALGHAQIARALGEKHKFEEWEGVGRMMESLSESALAPAPEALAQALEVAGRFQAQGIGLNGSYFLWGIARGLITAGDRTAAANMLNVALKVAADSGETRMNPEIWMLQAEIESDRSEAIQLLVRAHRLAADQAAVATALRAAAAIMQGNAKTAGVEWARSTLEILDGRAPVPDGARWMNDELAYADGLLKAFYANA